jgi:hypothetical protein
MSANFFCLRLLDDGLTSSFKVIVKGAWLPSGVDEEDAGNEEAWKVIENRWASLIQFDGRVLRYRKKPTESFKIFTP